MLILLLLLLVVVPILLIWRPWPNRYGTGRFRGRYGSPGYTRGIASDYPMAGHPDRPAAVDDDRRGVI